MTPSMYTWGKPPARTYAPVHVPDGVFAERLAFAYLAQCRCDPENTMVYFAHLVTIVDAMVNRRVDVPEELQKLIIEERERCRFTPEDYVRAANALGFGRDSELGVELDADVDDEFIAQAWRSARQRAWQRSDAHTRRAELNDALKVVAEMRASKALLKIWSEEKGTGMSPETAYSTLEVPNDVEESILLTVYSMRVSVGQLESSGRGADAACRSRTSRARQSGCGRL